MRQQECTCTIFIPVKNILTVLCKFVRFCNKVYQNVIGENHVYTHWFYCNLLYILWVTLISWRTRGHTWYNIAMAYFIKSYILQITPSYCLWYGKNIYRLQYSGLSLLRYILYTRICIWYKRRWILLQATILLHCKVYSAGDNEIHFGMNHAPDAGSIVRFVDLKSSSPPLCCDCPHTLYINLDYLGWLEYQNNIFIRSM